MRAWLCGLEADHAAGHRRSIRSGRSVQEHVPVMLAVADTLERCELVAIARDGFAVDDARPLIKAFADQAVIAIENAWLFDEVQARTTELARSVEELRALGEVSQAVNSTLDLETVLTTIVAKAVQLSHTDAGVIYVFDELDQTLRVRATYGLSDELVAAIRGQTAGASDALRRAIQDRQPLEIADIRDEPPSPVREIAMRPGL